MSDFIEAGKKFDLTKMATMINPSNSSSKEKITDLMNDKKNNDQYQKYFLDYFKENAAKITDRINMNVLDDYPLPSPKADEVQKILVYYNTKVADKLSYSPQDTKPKDTKDAVQLCKKKLIYGTCP